MSFTSPSYSTGMLLHKINNIILLLGDKKQVHVEHIANANLLYTPNNI